MYVGAALEGIDQGGVESEGNFLGRLTITTSSPRPAALGGGGMQQRTRSGLESGSTVGIALTSSTELQQEQQNTAPSPAPAGATGSGGGEEGLAGSSD